MKIIDETLTIPTTCCYLFTGLGYANLDTEVNDFCVLHETIRFICLIYNYIRCSRSQFGSKSSQKIFK